MKFDVLAYPKLLFDVLLIEFEVSRCLSVRFFFVVIIIIIIVIIIIVVSIIILSFDHHRPRVLAIAVSHSPGTGQSQGLAAD